MLQVDEEITLAGGWILGQEKRPEDKLFLLKKWSHDWEEELFLLEKRRRPLVIRPEEEPAPDTVSIKRISAYWLQICVTDKTWTQKLSRHPYALLEEHNIWLGGTEETQYLLPVMMMDIQE